MAAQGRRRPQEGAARGLRIAAQRCGGGDSDLGLGSPNSDLGSPGRKLGFGVFGGALQTCEDAA